MSKTNPVLVILLYMYVVLGSCNLAFSQTNISETDVIVNIVDLKYTGSVGWGDIYSCKIKGAMQEEISDTIISLYVSCCGDSSDKETDSIIKNVAKKNLQVIAKFRQIQNDKTYVNYITGFIDKENRTWKMIDLKSIVK
ncbi:MAG: hypothetical protein PHZ24_07255 [Bacteroidales bacterium]|nr:hypothetical protein [Bacteroidales bacterium]